MIGYGIDPIPLTPRIKAVWIRGREIAHRNVLAKESGATLSVRIQLNEQSDCDDEGDRKPWV